MLAQGMQEGDVIRGVVDLHLVQRAAGPVLDTADRGYGIQGVRQSRGAAVKGCGNQGVRQSRGAAVKECHLFFDKMCPR